MKTFERSILCSIFCIQFAAVFGQQDTHSQAKPKFIDIDHNVATIYNRVSGCTVNNIADCLLDTFFNKYQSESFPIDSYEKTQKLISWQAAFDRLFKQLKNPDRSSNRRFSLWKRELRDVYLDYRSSFSELMLEDSTATRVEKIHSYYSNSPGQSSSTFDKLLSTVENIQSTVSCLDKRVSEINSVLTQVDEKVDSVKNTTDDILALLSPYPNVHFVQGAFFENGIAGIGFLRKTGNLKSKWPNTLLAEVLFPYNARDVESLGFAVSAGLQSRQFNFLAGICYLDKNSYEDVSWKAEVDYFSSGWGIGISYSPLLNLGIKLAKAIRSMKKGTSH